MIISMIEAVVNTVIESAVNKKSHHLNCSLINDDLWVCKQ